MKKAIIFIISFVSFISFYNCVKTYAGEVIPTAYGFWVLKRENSAYYDLHVMYYRFVEWKYPVQGNLDDNLFFTGDQVHVGEFTNLEDAIADGHNWVLEHPFGSRPVDDHSSVRVEFNTNVGPGYEYWVYNFPFRYYPPDTIIHDLTQPPEPEPGSSWFDNMWNWFTDILGLTDDFSDELKDWIFDIGDGTGGHSGGHSFDVTTPSPTPSPTPIPTPTPFDLTINYPDGTTGTITDIPGSTIIINGGDETTNNYGSDFDIFEVDLKIGDGDSVNPRDGLNSVMDSNQNYLQEVDTSPITSSFSIIPNDWFVLIGVLGAIPFIAGFISKLLK